jgi:hypothetical protein
MNELTYLLRFGMVENECKIYQISLQYIVKNDQTNSKGKFKHEI